MIESMGIWFISYWATGFAVSAALFFFFVLFSPRVWGVSKMVKDGI